MYKDKDNYHLVFKYTRDGTLQDYINSKGKLTEKKSCVILWQLFKAIDYIHKKGFIHRDIKPDNILIVNKDTL